MQKRYQHEDSSGVRNTDFLLLIHIKGNLHFLRRKYYLRGSIIQEIFSVQMSGYVVHTYGPSGEYQDSHVCLKAASVWAFDYIMKLVNLFR